MPMFNVLAVSGPACTCQAGKSAKQDMGPAQRD